MLDEQSLKEFHELLLARRQHLESIVDNLEEGLSDLERSRPAELSEEAQEEAVAASLQILNEQEHRELGDIIDALQRIRNGTFGRCEACSQPITKERLKALPMVRHCITCQQRIEAVNRS